jgi:hypothetical protein
LRALVSEHNRISSLQNHQRPVQRWLAEPLALDHLPPQRSQARAPADRQSALELRLHASHFIIELAATLRAALVDGIHGGAKEETDGLVDVLLCGDGGEGELGEGLGDADNGFELANGDGDGRAGVGLEF